MMNTIEKKLDTYIVSMEHNCIGCLVEIVRAAAGDAVSDLNGAFNVHIVALLVEV